MIETAAHRARRQLGGMAPGQFREQQAIPQQAGHAVIAELQFGMSGEPGIRASDTTRNSSRVYHGAGFVPQRYTRPPSQPNDPDILRVVAGAQMNARPALSRTRGRGPGVTL